MRKAQFLTLAALALVGATSAPPVPALDTKPRETVEVYRVTDGDTLLVGPLWMGQPRKIRLAHIDTPEKGKFAKCAAENEHSLKAKANLEKLVADAGWKVVIGRVKKDDAYNRPIMDVWAAGVYANEDQVKKGFAFSYEGATKGDWCAALNGAANDN